ncbi:MAG: diaminopimelate epimerase [Lentisphaerae bacterium GWF2_44_16]|nr:MAG: diaminopimelate epimerase [Lentisphaerae bacterium GWF2_44_16]
MLFSKMHGAGNDFIVVNLTGNKMEQSPGVIKKLCDRHRGIGADGVIFLSANPDGENVKMDFYNSDGSRAGMCGNGLRCAGLFAYRYMVKKENISFITDAGLLHAEIKGTETLRIDIPVLEDFTKQEMPDGKTVYRGNTGVPHAIVVVEDIKAADVFNEGRKIRYHALFAPAGTNVNFIALPPEADAPIRIRTYERGVEDETLACGTGITAAAVCAFKFLGKPLNLKFITEDNDNLSVELQTKDNIVCSAKLSGPAVEVFQGELKTETSGIWQNAFSH